MNTAIMADRVSAVGFEEIQRQYLQMTQLKGFIWKEIEQTTLDLETQRKILNMTYFFTSNSEYTPSVSYQRLFLRHLLKLCEENGSEISDELYEAYGEVFSKAELGDDKCYKTYTLPCGAMITLEETQQYISQGTTGLSTWMAGEYLAEWALENTSKLQQRNIIELGCGTGLTGLVICSTSSPHKYFFTDCHERVVEALQRNLGLNGFVPSCKSAEMDQTSLCWKGNTSAVTKSNVDKNLGKSPLRKSNLSKLHITDDNQDNLDDNQRAFRDISGVTNSCIHGARTVVQTSDCVPRCMACDAHLSDNSAFNVSCNGIEIIAQFSRKAVQNCQHLNEDCGHHSGNVQVGVCQLDWSTLKRSDLENFPVGIILAADVIYDIELIPHLVRTVHSLLSTCGDEVGRPVAYIASTIRNPMTYKFFINQLSEHNINWSEVPKPGKQVFYYDCSCEIKIIRLEV